MTLLRALEQGMASESRLVISPWRAALILRRATLQTPPGKRRWRSSPTSFADARTILERLASSGGLELIQDTAVRATISGDDDLVYRNYPSSGSVFRVTSPFASTASIQEEEILFELHPYCALSHHTAMVFHNVTLDFPKVLHAIEVKDHSGILPIGTTNDDWDYFQFPKSKKVGRILNQDVRWHQVKFAGGLGLHRPHGYPIRVTSLERTLLDGLRDPDWCGGIGNVLSAWLMAKDQVNVRQLVALADELDITLLRQRAGYVLERLGLTHNRFSAWKAMANRGGRAKLLASAPFSSTFDPEWSLSINVSVEMLDGGDK